MFPRLDLKTRALPLLINGWDFSDFGDTPCKYPVDPIDGGGDMAKDRFLTDAPWDLDVRPLCTFFSFFLSTRLLDRLLSCNCFSSVGVVARHPIISLSSLRGGDHCWKGGDGGLGGADRIGDMFINYYSTISTISFTPQGSEKKKWTEKTFHETKKKQLNGNSIH